MLLLVILGLCYLTYSQAVLSPAQPCPALPMATQLPPCLGSAVDSVNVCPRWNKDGDLCSWDLSLPGPPGEESQTW